MQREAFEQLVSAWLDEPACAGLAARLETAEAAAPELGRLRDEYVRLHKLLGAMGSASLPVDWPALRAHVAAEARRLDARRHDESSLDECLREALPQLERRVNWPAFRRHLLQLAAAEARQAPRVLRLARWRGVMAAGALAAAAAVMLMVGIPMAPRPALEIPSPAGLVQVWIEPPPGVYPAEAPGGAVVLAKVLEDAETELLRLIGVYTEDEPASSPDPENYFMIEPLDLTGVVASAQTFGSH